MAKNDDKKPQQNDKKPESTEQTKVDAKPPKPPLSSDPQSRTGSTGCNRQT
jgi:heat shock protein HslJ